MPSHGGQAHSVGWNWRKLHVISFDPRVAEVRAVAGVLPGIRGHLVDLPMPPVRQNQAGV